MEDKPPVPAKSDVDLMNTQPIGESEDLVPPPVPPKDDIEIVVPDDPATQEPKAAVPVTPQKQKEKARAAPTVHFGDLPAEISPRANLEDITPVKKKGRPRGRRGGKKKGNSSADGATASINGNEISPPIPGAVTPSKVIEQKIMDKEDNEDKKGTRELGPLTVYEDQIKGTGSQGTTVYGGAYEGKVVAVKRLLKTFLDVAKTEVKILQESDYHENVVRYYCQQDAGEFIYIALELCPGSLSDVILNRHKDEFKKLYESMDPRETVHQIIRGLHHLHTHKIIHRDVKPQNILVGEPNFRCKHPRLLISDFGMCKKLRPDEYSLGATTAHNAGTIGWRAPELLPDISVSSDGENSVSGAGTGLGSEVAIDPITRRRVNAKIDVFAAGCVFYFVFTNGEHPFGDRMHRELNIANANSSHEKLETEYQHGWEVVDLVGQMIQHDQKLRPSTSEILVHPLWWSADKHLDFIAQASDRFETEKDKEKKDKEPSPILEALTAIQEQVCGKDWMSKLDPQLRRDLQENKRRGYDPTKLSHLLRVIRNKRAHFEDLPESVRKAVGETAEDYFRYFISRFPLLFIKTYNVVKEQGIADNARFQRFFERML